MGRVRLALAAALVLAALMVPGRALAASGMEIALQDDSVFVNRIYYNHTRALRQAVKLHVTRIRVNLGWENAVKGSRRRRAPRRPKYDWGRWDALVDAAGARGIKVQMALTGSAPRWATGNHRVGPYKPNPARFARFAQDAAKHFKGRIDRYSIWNEPNHRGWLAPVRSQASIYRSLYKRGYRAIKAVDPGVQVLIGETAPYASNPRNAQPPLRFLRALTCVNARYRPVRRCRLVADGYAHHPYDYLHSPTFRFPGADNVTMAGIPKLVRALNKLSRVKALQTPAGRPLDVYLTEFGYFARGKYKVKDATRGRWLVQAFQMAQRNPRVREMLQYLLVQPDRIHAFFDTSIVSRRGRLSRAYRKLANWAARAAKGGRVASPQPPPPPPPPPPSGGSGGGGGGGGQPPPPPPPPDPTQPVCLPGLPCPLP